MYPTFIQTLYSVFVFQIDKILTDQEFPKQTFQGFLMHIKVNIFKYQSISRNSKTEFGCTREGMYSDGGPMIEVARSFPLTFQTLVSLAA